jgi:serine/threonine protein kinase/tetratricopeptide (TPR) repeat protein
MIGQTISHYKILDKLGEGGMGVVYKAEDTRLKRIVALKFLPLGGLPDSARMARFDQEARAASALNHPNVCTIFDVTEQDGSPCIVMEFVDGGTLRSKIPVKGIQDAVAYALQIAEALAEAHAKGIVHRDIKTENIMVNSKNQIKVMDFGLAKIRDAVKLTRTSTTVGTLGYLAPELLQGAEADPRSDLFALGVVLYEMLAGVPPFRGEHEAALVYEILNVEPKSLNSFRTDVPASLQSVITDLLQRDPKQRIPTAAEVIQRLRSSGTLSPAPAEKSIAVLYFENMSSDPESDYFCAGMTEDIITDLCKIRELRVTPRSDVSSFRNRGINSRRTGEALQVKYILEGSVRKHGNRIRISAQLLDVKNGSHLWAERFDGTVEDVFDLQTDVAKKIAAALKISLTASQEHLLDRKPTRDLAAYDLYLRAKELLSMRGKKNNEGAIGMLEQAVALDGNFAAAHAALAEACSYMYMWYDGDAKWLTRAADASAKSLELEPGLAEAQFGLGMIRFHEQNYDAARALWEQAIRERPDFSDACRWLGIIADLKGEFDTSMRWYGLWERLRPYSEEPPMYMYMVELRRGNTEAANVAIHKMIDIAFKRLAVNPDDAVTMSRIAGHLGDLGQREKGFELLDRVRQLAPDDGITLYNSACSYSRLGEIDRAIDCLRRALDLGFRNVLMWVETDPDLAAIRTYPAYRAMMGEAR